MHEDVFFGFSFFSFFTRNSFFSVTNQNSEKIVSVANSYIYHSDLIASDECLSFLTLFEIICDPPEDIAHVWTILRRVRLTFTSAKFTLSLAQCGQMEMVRQASVRSSGPIGCCTLYCIINASYVTGLARNECSTYSAIKYCAVKYSSILRVSGIMRYECLNGHCM